MDTKPEVAQADPDPVENEVPSPSAQTPPPERLAEKRRRDEEDEDELVKLTGPKRRSSTSSNSGAGSILRKKSLSGSTENAVGVNSAPKRIAINIGPKSEPDTADESNEKENRDKGDAEGDH